MEEEIKLLNDEELDSFSSEDAYKMYIREVKQYKVLSIEEQKELAIRYIKEKDSKAKELLINSNLRWVLSIANKYAYRVKNLQILDIVQEGNLGLLRAIETYDPSKGAFSTYATGWIKQSITRAIADKEKTIRKPVHLEEAIRRYNYLLAEYEKKELPVPMDEEICEKLQINEFTLANIKKAVSQNIISLNTFVTEEEDTTLEDFIPSDEDIIEEVDEKLVAYDLCAVIKEILTDCQYYIVYNRVIAKNRLTLKYIGELFNITRERVRQIEASSLRRVRSVTVGKRFYYDATLKEIKEKEGKYYNYLNLKPISPVDIINYYYFKDRLSNDERLLYRLKLFGRYRVKSYASYLGLKPQEYEVLEKSLKQKLQVIDKDKYQEHMVNMILTYGTEIYNLIEEEILKEESETNLKRYLKSS